MNNPPSLTRRRLLRGTGAALLTSLSAGRLLGQEEIKVPTALQWLQQSVENAPLALRFQGSTADECRKWQAEFGATLRKLLGPHSPPAKWKTVLQRSIDLEDHRREELVLLADGVPPLPVYLLLPRPKAEKRRPGILALHGHGGHGHRPVAGCDELPGVAQAIHSCNYDYGRQLARQGFAVVVPCMSPFGIRLGGKDGAGKQDSCGDVFIRMQMLGKLLMAENLRDCLWALELLAQHEEVDAGRLGCVGLSYGGRMTMLTAAVEPRIKVAVVSGALNVMQERVSKPYGCGAQIIPRLLEFGDTPEIASLIAPRYCLWEVGSKDGLMIPKWVEEALTRIRRAYKALDAEDHLLVDRFEGGHSWNGKEAYPLLKKVLG
jgi:dienelactone hydrolase